MEQWRKWRYKNLTLLAFGLLVGMALYFSPAFHTFLLSFGHFGYFSAFIAGILFTSIFSASAAFVILLVLTQTLSPLEIGIIAGFGAVVGDLLIFRFVKDNLLEEIWPLYQHFGGKHVTHLIHSKYFAWTLPLVGAVIIASPLPDELGITLMGIANMRLRTFILFSFILNALGIFLALSAATALQATP